jgi:hypothetical protein
VVWVLHEVGVKHQDADQGLEPRQPKGNGTQSDRPAPVATGIVAGAPANSAEAGRWRPRFPAGIGLLLAASAALFLGAWLIDVYFFGRRGAATTGLGAWRLLTDLDSGTLQNALGSLAQVVVAVLGIAITVVSIVVQLAATRYTPRIAEMFFRDKTNLAIMGFFVVACLDAVWVSVVVTEDFVPRVSVAVTTVVVTASLLLLIPYFAYVFAFLDPEKVIARIGHQVLDAVLGKGTSKRDYDSPDVRQVACVAGLEHLADIAVNTVGQKDKIIATDAVTAMREFAVKYLRVKRELPPEWFLVGPRTHGNPDFIALAPDSLRSIEHKRVWVEWKVLRQFRSVFAETIEHLPELGHVLAIETRYVGEEALKQDDREVLVLAIRYFNTYLRTAINHQNIRTCYNVFHQYRLLAEHTMRWGHADLLLEIARCMAYYGQTAHKANLRFVTETAAHDLAVLCERVFSHQHPSHDQLLGFFLDVDKVSDTGEEEQALRGVRKAQIRLGTFYLANNAAAHADRIAADMRSERPGRLASIRSELLEVTDREFWEVTDRGVNFDFLDQNRKEKLDDFFARVRPTG